MGGQELTDIVDFHELIGESQWFGDDAKPQKTYIREVSLLAGYGTWDDIEKFDSKAMLKCQASRIGRCNEKSASLPPTCFVELLPLPNRTTNHWIYPGARKSFFKSLAPGRAGAFQQLISRYHPQAVVFLSTDRI